MLVLIPLNALILQPLTPSWLTGKIGDLAWMVVLPLTLSALLSLIWPEKARKSLFWAGAALAGLAFAALKTLPAANQAAGRLFFYIFQTPLKLALAAMADAVDPGYYQVDCVAVYEDTLVAFPPERASGYFFPARQRKVYTSTDNGLTWIDQGVYNLKELGDIDLPGRPPLDDLLAQCAIEESEVTITDPKNDSIQYVIISEKGVYRSEDSGSSLPLEFDAAQSQTIFENAVLAPDGETLVIAAVYDGLLLRLPDGSYEFIDPSGMSDYEP